MATLPAHRSTGPRASAQAEPEAEPLTANDARQIYCRRLGHHLGFGYCRTTDGRPCHKILDCWFETFDVASFLDRHYPDLDLAALTAPPRPKLTTLVELIQRARQAQAGSAGG